MCFLMESPFLMESLVPEYDWTLLAYDCINSFHYINQNQSFLSS